jgi:hypothetical protein
MPYKRRSRFWVEFHPPVGTIISKEEVSQQPQAITLKIPGRVPIECNSDLSLVEPADCAARLTLRSGWHPMSEASVSPCGRIRPSLNAGTPCKKGINNAGFHKGHALWKTKRAPSATEGIVL